MLTSRRHLLDHDQQTENTLVSYYGNVVEAREGVRFIIRSRLFSDDEWRAIEGR